MTDDDGPSFLDRYLPYLLRQADQALSGPFYATLTTHGVARSEWRVLAVLNEQSSMPLVDLAAASLSPQPTVTHAVRRLEKRGLVTSTPGETDKRQRFIAITAEGADLTETLIQHARELEAMVLDDLGGHAGAEGIEALIDQLRTLTRRAEKRSG